MYRKVYIKKWWKYIVNQKVGFFRNYLPKIMEEYLDEAKVVSQDEEVIGLYDKELKDKFVKYHEIEDAKTISRNETKIEIAKELLKNKKLSITDIISSTGLTETEINSLK